MYIFAYIFTQKSMNDIKIGLSNEYLSESDFLINLKSLRYDKQICVHIDNIIVEITASIRGSSLVQRIYTVYLKSKKKSLTLVWEGFGGKFHKDASAISPISQKHCKSLIYNGRYTYTSEKALWDDLSVMIIRYKFGHFDKYQTKLLELADEIIDQMFDQALNQVLD
jgi:hypothetical protein